jgi:hypothetical protein
MDRELLRVLLERAEQDDPNYSWHADVNNICIRLNATTREPVQDIEAAWQAAKDLRDSITDLGYGLYGTCQLGVISEHSTDGEPGQPGGWPITSWRGTVELLCGTNR